MLNSEYIVGLVDGEGSFSIHVWTPRASLKRRALVELRFYVKLNERDLPLLKELQQFFGCGKIYAQKDKRPNHRDCYRYEVFNRQELADTIIPFFEKHPPRSLTKQKDFKIFRHILELVQAKEHFTKTGLENIQTLKIQMH
ncbi:MAG: LAGLIDADG family homing endonuclease [Candidatus Andersenbacteria bacterium]